MAYRYRMGWRSAQGRRSSNQDAAAADPEQGFGVIADGMGGAAAGDRASRLAVELAATRLGERLRTTDPAGLSGLLAELVAEVNAAVHGAAEADPNLRGMGTTLVVAALRGDRCGVAHVGDSRAYRIRDGCLTQLSRDHSLVQARVDAGLISAEEARHQVDRNVITRAVGVEAEVTPDIVVEEVREDDLLVLTTDGVHAFLPESALLQAASAGSPEVAADRLVEEALAQGSNDNATAAVIRIVRAAADTDTAELDDLLARPLTGEHGSRRSLGTGSRWVWAAVLGLIAAAMVYLAPRILSSFLGIP